MAYVAPNPGDRHSGDRPGSESPHRRSGALGSLVKAEQLMQIAFVLPCAMVLGWGTGWCVDHFFHTEWAVAVGLVLGIIAGMVSAIRMAVGAMDGPPSTRDRD